MLYVGATRFGARELLRMRGRRREPVIIYGAGAAGAQLCASLHEHAASSVRWRSSTTTQKCTARGSAACGSCAGQTARAAPPHGVEPGVPRACPAPRAAAAARSSKRSSAQGFKVQTVPDIGEIVSGQARLEEVRDIDVHDLLGRDPVPPNPALLSACVRGKSILVTGAGGSIGSELCRQIMELSPRRLVLLEVSELALYEIERELRSLNARLGNRIELVALLGNAHHKHRVREIMTTFGDPDRVSRGRVQARADRRTQHDRGHPQQHLRHLQHGGGGAGVPRRDLRAHLHRQGRESDQRHGLHQARRGDGAAGPAAARSRHALLHGALRQRARVLGLGGAAVPRADSRRRPGHRHAPGRHPLLHDHSRSRAAGHPGRLDGLGRRRVRARHGQPGAHRRSRASA